MKFVPQNTSLMTGSDPILSQFNPVTNLSNERETFVLVLV
jgi:hypothetical protein